MAKRGMNSAMGIQVLPQDVINQIAAGEVVERPAHLVKELVENSIDAKATEVEVEFDQGGRYVKVRDNGCGLSKEDLNLALSRHATSKITEPEDLWALKSFGFRGEALASIASVSRLKIISKVNDRFEPEDSGKESTEETPSHAAWELLSEFGQYGEPIEVGGDVGTTVIIHNLFENTPARLKFLKSDGAESSQIKNVLKAIALAHPTVSFRVRTKGQLLFYWPAVETHLERAKAVLDQSEMYEAEFIYEDAKAKVVLCAPQVTTGNSKQIWGFVQNRWVQDRSLQAAIMDAFRNLLMHGEFPIAAYWLEVPADDVDVNIHPTKSQVKFRDSKMAFRAVNRAARTVLEAAPWLGDLIPEAPVTPQFNDEKENQTPDLVQTDMKDFAVPELNKVQFAQKTEPQFAGAPNNINEPGFLLSETHLDLSSDDHSGDLSIDEMQSLEKEMLGEAVTGEKPVDPAVASMGAPQESTEKWARLQVLGQADLTYIVTQSEKGLVFVDQHAAHERVMFERMMKAWNGQQIEVQNYLLPLTVTLDEEQVEAILECQTEIEKLGLSVESMGPKILAVSAAPQNISERSIVKVLEKLGRELVDYGDSFAFEKSIGDIVATMACHSAIRAGQALSHQQMESLLEQMDEFPLSSFCPHGRPVFVEYSFNKLERDFGRIV